MAFTSFLIGILACTGGSHPGSRSHQFFIDFYLLFSEQRCPRKDVNTVSGGALLYNLYK